MSHTTQLKEPIRIDIGKMLLAHELEKLLPNLGTDYDKLRNLINQRWSSLDGVVAIRDFWNLLDSVMMGYELKDIIALITSEKTDWKFEERHPINELIFGWGEKLGDYRLNGRSAGEVIAYLENHKDLSNDLKDKYKNSSPRIVDPIIVEKYLSNGSLHVHDGNGRLLRAIAINQSTLPAYIGSQNVRTKSNQWVPTSYLQRLTNVKAEEALAKVLSESENAVFEFKDRVVVGDDFRQEVLKEIGL